MTEDAGERPEPAVHRNLLERPWVLSQRPLLTERRFLDALKHRDLLITEGHLEVLHREGILVPWLRVDRDMIEVRRAFRRRNPDVPRWELLGADPPTQAPDLAEEWSAGLVGDGLDRPFETWRRRIHRRGEIKYRAWDYLYSPYQLLLLREIKGALRYLGSRGRPRTEGFLDAMRRSARKERSVIPLLTELEFVYYPLIGRRTTLSMSYGSEEKYNDALRAFDPVDVLQRSGRSAEALLAQAERWLWEAHSSDPLRNWVDLVGRIDPRKWERLEGSALAAMDLRIAAEMILRFLEDLAAAGAVPGVPDHAESNYYHPLQDRIGRGRSRLERVLTDFGISPHPAVILILEGPTERFAVNEAMPLLGIPILDSFIRLQLLGGVEKQIELLARYIAPALGRTQGTLADMNRPPTRLLIVADAEGKYSTPTKRTHEKVQLVKHLYNALEQEHQTPTALHDLAFLVEIETWDPVLRNFEFAHFTDYAIANAILATGKAPSHETLASLTAAVSRRRTGGKNLKFIWESWANPTDKLEVWRHLWPILRDRIRRAQKRGTEERIPLVRVLRQAERLASGPRSNTVLRVGP